VALARRHAGLRDVPRLRSARRPYELVRAAAGLGDLYAGSPIL